MTKLLCDENLPIPSFEVLNERNLDVRTITYDEPGIPDEDIVARSHEENRVIVTFDSDFGTLIFRDSFKPFGVIYIRWQNYRPHEPGEFIAELILGGELEFEGKLTVIEKSGIRQRSIPI